MMTFGALLGSLELGMIYAVLALGVFLSFRTLNMPDLTVDGSIVTRHGNLGSHLRRRRASASWRFLALLRRLSGGAFDRTFAYQA